MMTLQQGIMKTRRTPFILYLTISVISTLSIFMLGSNAGASPKIQKVYPSLKALDLSKSLTTDEIMAAGQLGGQLYPTKETKDKKETKRSIFLSARRLISGTNMNIRRL